MNYLLTAVVSSCSQSGNFTNLKTTVCDFTKPYCSYFVPGKNQILQQFILS